MIEYNKQYQYFHLTTKHTSYIFYVNPYQHVEHLYYGARINEMPSIDEIKMRYEFELGSATSYDENAKGYMLNHILLEVSSFGKGDYREPTIHIELPDGSRTLDFLYDSYQIVQDKAYQSIPQVRKKETLTLVLKDKFYDIYLHLNYSIFDEEDCIVRNIECVNHTDGEIVLDKILSAQLDLLNEDYKLIKLYGAWIRERHISHHTLTPGTIRFDSKKGVSSSDHNPFFILSEQQTTEHYGNAFGFALVYSGNFEANIELSPHNLCRLNLGINSFDFRYPLKSGEQFITPEVIFSYSNHGINQLSEQFHHLIMEHIIPPNFNKKERPIVINNWEATYFDFNQKKIIAIAKQAKKLGMELFCLDDGWFSRRNDDVSSLGDWQVNKKKIPGGLHKLAKKINKLGLEFGIWVEPEMVSPDSELYKTHPDWAITIPKKSPSLGRNQLILDLTNEEVRTFIKETLTSLFESANITYCKWDMNRNFSDVFSQHLPVSDQGQFYYLYVMGLYDILEYLTKAFPYILFESCSSGGNRFDLGMLYYMPQTWTSDNTDALERLYIQEGTSLLYPLSSMSNHVCGERSHQVFRYSPLETRFHVASFGILGYELDLTVLTTFEKKVIQKQISFYKEYRNLFQFGTLKRLSSVYDSNYTIWMVHNEEKSVALLGLFAKHSMPNSGFQTIRIPDLNKTSHYHIKTRTQYANIREFGSLVNEALPIKLKVNHFLHNLIANHYLFQLDEFNKVLTGNQLEHMRLLLHHQFTGTGYNESVMFMPDYGSRLFIIEEEKN